MFKGKRLLSLLIAICVLVSAIVPVAMITADTPQKTMVKLELNADKRMRLNNITIEKGVNYILSFDYNLSGLESGCEYKVYDFTTENDFEPVYLENGVGHVEVTYAMNSTSNANRTRITFITDCPNTKLYIGNFSIVKEGTEVNLAENATWDTSVCTILPFDEEVLPEDDDDAPPVSDEIMTKFQMSNDATTYKSLFLNRTATYKISFTYALWGLEEGTYFDFYDLSPRSTLPRTNLQNGIHQVDLEFKIKDVNNPDISVGIGFGSNCGAATLYVKDLKVCMVGSDVNMFDGKNWSNTTRAVEMPYDELCFEYPPEKMYEVKFPEETETNLYKLFNTSNLTVGSEYTFEVSYFLSDSSAKYKIIDFDDNVRSFTSQKLYSGKYKIKFNFTYENGDVVAPALYSNNIGEDAKLYIWNYKLYKKGTETNIAENVTWNDASLISELDYNEKLFVPVVPKMYQIKLPQNSTTSVYKQLADLSVGENYNVSFKYFLSSSAGTYKFIDAIGENSFAAQSLKEGNNKANFSFTYQSGDVVAPGVWSNNPGKNVRLYIWDLEVVKSATVKNIARKIAWNNTEYALEMDYDESLFTSGAEKMYQIKLEQGKTNSVYQVFDSSIISGTEYEFSMDYFVSNDYSVLRLQDITAVNPEFGYRDLEAGMHTLKFRFKAGASKVAPGIWTNNFSPITKVYVWNIRLVKVGTTVNMAANKNWYNADKAIEMAYDESLFVEGLGDMYQVDFSKSAETTPSLYKEITGLTPDTQYQATLNYYLSTKDCNYVFKDISGLNDDFAATKLEQGEHSITVTFTAGKDGKASPGIWSDNIGKKVRLFIWDLTVTEKGKGTDFAKDVAFNDDTLVTKMEYDASEFNDGSIVMYQIKLTPGTTNSVYKVFEGGMKQGERYVFSFDYYIADYSGSYRVQDISQSSEFGYHDLAAGLGSFSTEFVMGKKVAPGLWSNSVGKYDVMFIWNVKLYKVGSTKNLSDNVKWNNLAKAVEMKYDESLFKTHPDVVTYGPQALRLEHYYYDAKNQLSYADKEFLQRMGTSNNGVEVKASTTYEFSFDYYSSADYYVGKGGAIVKTLFTGAEKPNLHMQFNETAADKQASKFQQGRNSMKLSFTTNSEQTDFMVGFYQGQMGTTFIWNVKLVEKGTTKNLLKNADFSMNDAGWYCAKDPDDPSKPIGMFTFEPINQEMVKLPIGGILPDMEALFYEQDLWGDGGLIGGWDTPVYDNNEVVTETAPVVEEEVEEEGINVLLIVLIAAGALVVVAGVVTSVIIIRKKKKA